MIPDQVNYETDIAWYYETFPARLREAAEEIQRHQDDRAWLRVNFGLFIELLRKAQSCLSRQVVDQAACADAALELLDRLGDWPRLWLNWIDSEGLLQFAVQLAGMRGEHARQADFLNRLSGVYIDTARKLLAVETLDRALILCHTYRLGSQLIKVTGTQINLLIDQKELDEAARRLDELVADLPDMRIPTEDRNEAEGQLLVVRGWLQRQCGDLGEARINMINAIEALRLADNIHSMAPAYRLLGLIHNTAGHPHEALKALKQARYWFKSVDDDFVDSWVIGNMGLTYWGCGQLNQAEKAFAISTRWAHTHYAFRQEVHETGNRGLVALSQGRLPGAERLLREHKRMAEHYEIEDEIWRATGNLGVACYHRGLYDEALALLDEEDRHNAQRKASIWGRLGTCINLARCYSALGDLEAGMSYLQQVIPEAGLRPDNDRMQVVCWRGLADVRIQEARWIGQLDGIPVESAPRTEAIACLKNALRYAKWRPLDRAGCYLSLAGLTDLQSLQQHFWDQGVALLDRCGALSWLQYPVDNIPVSPNHPPRLPIFF